MRFARDLRTVGAVALKDFRAAVSSWKFLIVSVAAGVILLLLAYGVSSSAIAAQASAERLTLWQRGAEGAVAAFAFGFLPLVIPLVAVGLSYDARRKDRASGFLETALSRPAPRWAIALGGFLGLFVAISITVLLITLAGIAIIEARLSALPSWDLVAPILIGALLLTALYLGLVLLLTTFLTPGATTSLMVLLWFVFNLTRQTPFIISGQFLLILQIKEAQTFETGWADWLSFTGMYQGFLAPFVPESLVFVVRPVITDLGAALAYQSVLAAGLVWLFALVILYLALVTRYPLGR